MLTGWADFCILSERQVIIFNTKEVVYQQRYSTRLSQFSSHETRMPFEQILKRQRGSQKAPENGQKSIFPKFEMAFSYPYPLIPMLKFKYPKSRDKNLQFEVCLNFLAQCPKHQRPREKGQFWPRRHVWLNFSQKGNIFPWI